MRLSLSGASEFQLTKPRKRLIGDFHFSVTSTILLLATAQALVFHLPQDTR